jgi:hypothetical protein
MASLGIISLLYAVVGRLCVTVSVVGIDLAVPTVFDTAPTEGLLLVTLLGPVPAVVTTCTAEFVAGCFAHEPKNFETNEVLFGAAGAGGAGTGLLSAVVTCVGVADVICSGLISGRGHTKFSTDMIDDQYACVSLPSTSRI